ncbi:MAG TPA: alpha/beta fold hydrolase [Devosia sp.]
MPCIDKPLHELQEYRGINPRPGDFDTFWDNAIKELDSVKANVEFKPVNDLGNVNAELFDLTFTGVGGARIYAKYLRPKNAKKCPAVIHFHGYSGNSGDWHDKLSFVNEGFAVAALDCRGQGGRSEDNSQVTGNTREGHLIRGLDGPPEKLLFRQIFLDTAQLARIVMAQPEVDPTRVASWGGSQGGALSLVCAALEPRIRKCVSIFPFLSDYKRVWEMDLAKDAYNDIKAYFRRFDPLHERVDEVFTKLGYIDIQHLTPRIKADVLMAVTLMDNICPPSTQYAAYNKITSKKDAIIFRDFGHEGLPLFNDKAFKFLMDLKA